VNTALVELLICLKKNTNNVEKKCDRNLPKTITKTFAQPIYFYRETGKNGIETIDFTHVDSLNLQKVV
jgi:hypothetical protein